MARARSCGGLASPLGTLYTLGAAGTLTDGQLLERFLARNAPETSEAAFATLVDRHGAMVLAVCRNVLGNTHDAHDAFQATFLVLVNKAGSIRRRESVGGWLVGIARRVAARARLEGARRRRRLQQLGAKCPSFTDDREGSIAADPQPDFAPLIAEVDRLPERFRTPVVLHYFEGLSTEATAQRLGCARGTVLSRLSRARRRIKARLEQQGVSFTALIPAGEVLTRWIPPAPVPAWLAQTTVQAAGALALAGAAIESVVPAAVASLSCGVARTLVLSKVRADAALMVLAVAGVSIGLAATYTVTDETRRGVSGQAPMNPPQRAVAKIGTSQTNVKAEGERFEYAGRVLDPDGKPVAGARLRLAYQFDDGPVPPLVRATTDAQGRFRFTATERDFETSTGPRNRREVADIVAVAQGFGIGFTRTRTVNPKEPIDPLNLTIRLVRDDAPIEGRILDLEGRPVSGARVLPGEAREPIQGDLSAWLDAVKQTHGGSSGFENRYLRYGIPPGVSVLPAATTDGQGRFTIRGLGRERLIRLKVEGPTIQTQTITVLTRNGDPISVNRAEGRSNRARDVYYGARFDFAAAPTKPIIGTVRDQDSGKPLAGVVISSHESPHRVYNTDDIETTSDSEGRFRLVGLPQATKRRIFAFPNPGQPYLAAAADIPDSPGFDLVMIEIPLRRGIQIEGRVLDQKTGEPVEAWVFYHAHRDNASLPQAEGFKKVRIPNGFRTGLDGRFQVVGLPGRGLLAAVHIAHGDQGRYLIDAGLAKAISRDTILPFVPGISIRNINTLTEIDLTPDTPTIRRDLFLQPGLTVKGRALDPQGQPLAGARIFQVSQPWNGSWAKPSGEFAIEGLRSGEERQLDFSQDERKLAARVTVRGGDPNEVIVRLQPWAAVTGRVIDEDGHPQANMVLMSSLKSLSPRETDLNGRFRYEPIIPGRSTEITVSKDRVSRPEILARDLVLNPGETRDLGDVRVTRP